MRDSEFKKNIDALAVRYLPWIGIYWARCLVFFLLFVIYSFLIFPFKNLTRERGHAFVLVTLFCLSILADLAFLTGDISRAITARHEEIEGVLEEYDGRRGLATAHFIVFSDEPYLFKTLTIRGKGARKKLESRVGDTVHIEFIVARGLFTVWKLPVQIVSRSGGKIYDYRDHVSWFENPSNPADKYILAAFWLISLFSLIFFPVKSFLLLVRKGVSK